MRYLVRDKAFAIGDDSWIEDENGDRAFLLDGKALRLRQTYELTDTADQVVAKIRKKWLRVRDTYAVEVADGPDVALVLAVAVAIDALAEPGRDH